MPEQLRAFCGLMIRPGQAELVTVGTGMPCVACVMAAPDPEHLAPQLIRNDVLVRETVTGLLRQARCDAGGRELRGLAWRMGVAPNVNLVRCAPQLHVNEACVPEIIYGE
jgi:hypothetical protein